VKSHVFQENFLSLEGKSSKLRELACIPRRGIGMHSKEKKTTFNYVCTIATGGVVQQ
jgi:hypothetical protein